MPLRKVVIPVAGLGTRLLPTTKALPKEMLPVGRYPAIQHVVEEMVAADLKKVLFVTSRGKAIIENQFDNNVDVVIHLEQNGRLDDLGDFDYSRRAVEFFYTRQQVPPGSTKPQGTGAAVAAAESFADDEHFVVAYGDTIISSARETNFIGRMIEAHERHDATCTVGSRYGVVKPASTDDGDSGSFRIEDIVEKPAPGDAPSHLAVTARYIFGPEIFDEIRKLEPGEDRELGITDAIRGLIRSGHTVRCVRLESDETRYDIGSHESYYKVFIDFALQDPHCGDEIRRYIQSLSGKDTNQATPGGG